MKKTTLVSIVMMILLTVSVAAAVSVTYNFYDMHNNQPLNNVDVLGYPCNDAACSSLRLNSPLQGSGNSGTKSTLTLIFPTKLVTPQGYAVYYFRPGYAPQEYRADWWGTLNTHYSIPFNKISECKANIGNVDVQFDNSDSRWELEAHVSSAFTDINSRVNYIPSGFEDYYSSEVFIEVQVYDDEDNFVIGRETTRNILMDNSVSPVFNLGTFDPGNYTAVITTIVIDDQCSSYSDQSKTVHFEVAAQPEDDLEVTLSADPVFGEEPLNVELTCTAANGGSPYTFTFFEDGDEFFSVTLTQPQASITRTFFEGLYNLTCEVQDYHAETAADSVMIIVSESSETPLCSDGIDNDGDGLVDYPADPGCEDADDDNETDPVTLPECSDGLDNDGDGLVDYPADLGCENSGDDDETDSVVIPECDDGLDNDNDGLVDLDDPGCENENDDNETDPAVPPECSDGLDNDGDGLVDLADPGCVNAGDDDETNVICVNHFEISSVRMDGVNVQEGNTYNVPASALSNGYIPFDYYFRNTGIRDIFGRNYTTTMVIGGFIAAQDLSVMPDVNAYSTIIEGQDFDISSALAQGVYNLTVVAYGHDEDACIQADTFQFYARVNASAPVYACSDSIDNDGDGLVDAYDPGCYDSGAYNPFDNNEHDTLPECSDHFDNDDDNHIDLADPGCEDANDDDETDPVTLPECADGLDNDGDGLVDYPADLGCENPGDDDETDSVVIPECADGLDNDGDGLV
ncbi:MAG: hypothetical protein KKE20_05140, partial [Nanoarchaeota archaeon]|nr:hypothetical protein [Nanoarchaeota archaeon]